MHPLPVKPDLAAAATAQLMNPPALSPPHSFCAVPPLPKMTQFTSLALFLFETARVPVLPTIVQFTRRDVVVSRSTTPPP